MVVELLYRLVSISSIKGDSFIDEGIAIPVAITLVIVGRFLVAACRGVVGKGVSGVEEGNAINEEGGVRMCRCWRESVSQVRSFRSRKCAKRRSAVRNALRRCSRLPEGGRQEWFLVSGSSSGLL